MRDRIPVAAKCFKDHIQQNTDGSENQTCFLWITKGRQHLTISPQQLSQTCGSSYWTAKVGRKKHNSWPLKISG
jgi:hypothetical protein